MKKKIIKIISILILISVFHCKTSNISNSQDEEEYEIQYTTADSLNVRKTPSINSEVITQIPFGTKLNTKNTKIIEIYEGKTSAWHLVKEVNGFVLDYFLNKHQINPTIKQLILKSGYAFKRCNAYGIGIYKSLKLSNNEALLTDEFIDFDQGNRKHLSGNYKLNKDSISIELQETEIWKMVYSDGNSNIIEKNKSKDKSIKIINLIWKEQLKGFITEDQKKYLDSEKYNFNIKKCIFTNKKCKHYDPFDQQCTEIRANSDLCDDIGYFCNR